MRVEVIMPQMGESIVEGTIVAWLKEIGDKYGKNEAQITLRWLIQQDNVAAIPKSGTPENIKNNIDIFDFELTSDEMHKIHSLSRKETRLIDLDGTQKWDKAA